MLKVINISRGVAIGTSVEVADTSAKRRTGLLNRDGLSGGEGLWIAPCEGVHTFFMKFAIDVLFLNKKKEVVKLRRNMPKSRISVCFKAASVLELPAGTADMTGTRVGDVLAFERCRAPGLSGEQRT